MFVGQYAKRCSFIGSSPLGLLCCGGSRKGRGVHLLSTPAPFATPKIGRIAHAYGPRRLYPLSIVGLVSLFPITQREASPDVLWRAGFYLSSPPAQLAVAAGVVMMRRQQQEEAVIKEAGHDRAGDKTASNRACARGGSVRLAKVPTASSEKGAREKHSVGLGRQVPRAVKLPGSIRRRASPPSRTDNLSVPEFWSFIHNM
jgi:hypothetical protein